MADNYLEKKFEEHNSQSVHQRTKQTKIKIRNIFVTRGANGVGQAVVRALRVAGNNVAFCDIDDVAGKELSATTGTYFLHADISQSEELKNAMKAVVDKWGRIDIIINNITSGKGVKLTEATTDMFDNVMVANVRPIFVTAQQMLLMHNCENRTLGRIINISAKPNTELQSAVSGAIISFTQSLAQSMAKYGINVNTVSYDPQKLNYDNMARIVRFLCDENSNGINGENIVCSA